MRQTSGVFTHVRPGLRGAKPEDADRGEESVGVLAQHACGLAMGKRRWGRGLPVRHPRKLVGSEVILVLGEPEHLFADSLADSLPVRHLVHYEPLRPVAQL